MRILKIADINSTHVRKLATSLTGRGHAIALCHLYPVWAPWPDVDERISIHPIVPRSKRSVPGSLHSIGAGAKIRKLARSFEPDVVHAHYVRTYGLAAALSGCGPLVISAWGSDVMDPGGPVSRWVVKYTLRRAASIHATSAALASCVENLVGKQAQVIPFGVDLDKFVPRDHGATTDDIIRIGSVKAIESVYGPRTLLDAFSELKKQLPDRLLRLVFVGEGTERAHITQRVQSLGLGDHVEFRGRIPHDAVPAALQEFDILANLSRHEGFGVSVVEAAACGIPAVATNIGGLREVVDEGRTGLLTAPGDVSAAAQALLQLVTNDELRAEMSLAARARAESLYDWEDCVDRVEEHYATMAGH